MIHFDGTFARQLDLLDVRRPAPVRAVAPARTPAARPGPVSAPVASRVRGRQRDLRMLRQDVYAAIERRRRQAQIAARRAFDDRRHDGDQG